MSGPHSHLPRLETPVDLVPSRDPSLLLCRSRHLPLSCLAHLSPPLHTLPSYLWPVKSLNLSRFLKKVPSDETPTQMDFSVEGNFLVPGNCIFPGAQARILGIILDTSLSLTPPLPSTSKPCWPHLQGTPRMHALLPPPLLLLQRKPPPPLTWMVATIS